jgi:hypothetical protein
MDRNDFDHNVALHPRWRRELTLTNKERKNYEKDFMYFNGNAYAYASAYRVSARRSAGR